MITSLIQHGYIFVSRGIDTHMVRAVALREVPRVKVWLEALTCCCCGGTGFDGVPFHYYFGSRTRFVGHCCSSLYRQLSSLASWDDWILLPNEKVMTSLATDGTLLWGLDANGAIHRHKEGEWQDFGACLAQLSICCEGQQLWGIDQDGQLVHKLFPRDD